MIYVINTNISQAQAQNIITIHPYPHTQTTNVHHRKFLLPSYPRIVQGGCSLQNSHLNPCRSVNRGSTLSLRHAVVCIPKDSSVPMMERQCIQYMHAKHTLGFTIQVTYTQVLKNTCYSKMVVK